MSRVPSANNAAAAAAAKPKRSLPPRGRPWGLTWELPLRGRGQARRSLGHHRPHNFDSSTRRRRRRRGRLSDRRAAALLRRGPARNCPSPRGRRASAAGSRSAAAASRRRGRLRPSGPRAPAPHRPRPPRGSEAPAARQAHGSSRELGAPPPAAAPSAGSLQPPPPPPSSAAAAAGKGAEETASLPLPTTHAQHGADRSGQSDLCQKGARAPGVSGATRWGAGLRRPGGPTGAAASGTRAPRARAAVPTCRRSSVSSNLCCFPTSPLELEKQNHGCGVRGGCTG